jgi:hypothetical protein
VHGTAFPDTDGGGRTTLAGALYRSLRLRDRRPASDLAPHARRAPLYRNHKYDFTRWFDDVLAASTDTETYSSAWAIVLEMMHDQPSTDA